MTRFRAKVDANHREIVAAFEALGATVQSLASVGSGCPDLAVGYMGRNYLVEVKDGAKPPSARALTDDEAKWHAAWDGTVDIVETVDDAIALVRGLL